MARSLNVNSVVGAIGALGPNRLGGLYLATLGRMKALGLDQNKKKTLSFDGNGEAGATINFRGVLAWIECAGDSSDAKKAAAEKATLVGLNATIWSRYRACGTTPPKLDED